MLLYHYNAMVSFFQKRSPKLVFKTQNSLTEIDRHYGKIFQKITRAAKMRINISSAIAKMIAIYEIHIKTTDFA